MNKTVNLDDGASGGHNVVQVIGVLGIGGCHDYPIDLLLHEELLRLSLPLQDLVATGGNASEAPDTGSVEWFCAEH